MNILLASDDHVYLGQDRCFTHPHAVHTNTDREKNRDRETEKYTKLLGIYFAYNWAISTIPSQRQMGHLIEIVNYFSIPQFILF